VPATKTKELVKTFGRQLRDRASVAATELPEIIEVGMAQLRRTEWERAEPQAASEDDAAGAGRRNASDASVPE
jgi:hypothetical protein